MVKPQEERAGGLLLCPTSQACCWHCLLSSTVGQLELPLDHTGLCTLVSLSGKVLIICLDMDLLLQDWGSVFSSTLKKKPTLSPSSSSYLALL